VHRKFSRWEQLAISIFAFCLLACATYCWIPNITPFEGTISFHNLQAKSFVQGKLELPIKVKPQILSAQNPFDRGLQVYWYWDAVFYKGHYYSYFGPFPAAIITVGKLLGLPTNRPDFALTIVFTCLRIACGAGVFYTFWRYCRPDSPAWILAIALVSLAWCNPIPFILGRIASYELGIVCAQALFLAGLFCDMRAILSKGYAHRWGLFSGALYGACIATRASLLPAVSIMVVTSGLLNLKRCRSKTSRIKHLLALLTPFSGALLCLGVMNQIRFGSPFESGQQYMMTVEMASPNFQPQFVLANLYSYFFRPVVFVSHFPFLSTIGFNEWFLQSTGPIRAYLEPVVGYFITTPLVVFIVFAFSSIKQAFFKLFLQNEDESIQESDALNVTFVIGGVALGFGALVPLLFYYAVTMRYSADCVAGMVMLSTVGLIHVVDRFTKRPLLRGMVVSVSILMAVYSIVAALAVCARLPHH
jgi:hypothetical protein